MNDLFPKDVSKIIEDFLKAAPYSIELLQRSPKKYHYNVMLDNKNIISIIRIDNYMIVEYTSTETFRDYNIVNQYKRITCVGKFASSKRLIM